MSFVERALREHQGDLGRQVRALKGPLGTVLVTPRFPTSRHVVALVFTESSDDPYLVVKVPRRPGDNGGVRREAGILARLGAAPDATVAGVPQLLDCFDVGPYTLLVETAIHGTALDPAAVAADRDRAVRIGADFVSALPVTRAAADNGDWYEVAVAAPLARLARLAPLQGRTARMVETTERFLRPLRESALPAVLEHADLSHPNLLVQPDGRLGVVDWERATDRGLPGHDLVFFLQYLAESAASAFAPPQQRAAFDAAFVDAEAWARPALLDHLRARGVGEELAPHILLATWARSAATLVERLVPEEAPVASVAPPSATQIAALVARDRDFLLWEHAVAQLAGRVTADVM